MFFRYVKLLGKICFRFVVENISFVKCYRGKKLILVGCSWIKIIWGVKGYINKYINI